MVRIGEDDGAGDGLHRLLPGNTGNTAALVMAHPDDVLQRTQPGEKCGDKKSESHMVTITYK